LFFSMTRWAWALGIPLGVTSEFLREEAEETPMIWYAGAFLGTLGAGGGLLTLGLIRPWGERFPRWMGRLAGRRVPPRLATIPATAIAILIVETGIMYNRKALTGTWDDEFRNGNWATVVPEMTWPVWGIALGAASLAYHYRRQGRCGRCGMGQPARGAGVASPTTAPVMVPVDSQLRSEISIVTASPSKDMRKV
jgi:hypothetical protein